MRSNLVTNRVNLLKSYTLFQRVSPYPFVTNPLNFHNFKTFLICLVLQKVTEEINKLEFAIDPDCNLTPEQTRALQEYGQWLF